MIGKCIRKLGNRSVYCRLKSLKPTVKELVFREFEALATRCALQLCLMSLGEVGPKSIHILVQVTRLYCNKSFFLICRKTSMGLLFPILKCYYYNSLEKLLFLFKPAGGTPGIRKDALSGWSRLTLMEKKDDFFSQKNFSNALSSAKVEKPVTGVCPGDGLISQNQWLFFLVKMPGQIVSNSAVAQKLICSFIWWEEQSCGTGRG